MLLIWHTPQVCPRHERLGIYSWSLKLTHYQKLSTLAICIAFGVTLFAAIPASAQCALTSGPGPTPWPTCTTWSGPAWVPWTVNLLNQGNAVQPIFAAADINGDGLADLVYIDAYMDNMTGNNGLALSTGSSFSASTPSLPPGACYQGNFDASGRSGVACISPGQIGYATSNGSGYSAFTKTSLSGNLVGQRQSAPAIAAPNPCLVMDVDGDGTDDIRLRGAG